MNYSKKTDLWLLHVWFWHLEFNDRDTILFELRERGYGNEQLEIS